MSLGVVVMPHLLGELSSRLVSRVRRQKMLRWDRFTGTILSSFGDRWRQKIA